MGQAFVSSLGTLSQFVLICHGKSTHEMLQHVTNPNWNLPFLFLSHLRSRSSFHFHQLTVTKFKSIQLCRVVISWYPTAKLNEFPYNIAVWPTEPLLMAIRGSVPPAFGVDITPIVWLAIFTFFNEILLGQQGLLTMKMKYGI